MDPDATAGATHAGNETGDRPVSRDGGSTTDLTRRGLLETAGGAVVAGAVASGASSRALAQASGPDYDGWFDDVSNFDGTVDARDQDTVEVTVGASGNNGNFAFGPAAVMVSPGTTVAWTWTGEGGVHNVVAEDGSFDSGDPVDDSEATFEHTFDDEGVYKYACTPHKAMGMKGAVVVDGSGDGGGSGGQSQGPPVTVESGAVGASLLLAFLSPVAFAAVLRRKLDGRAGDPPAKGNR